MLLNAQSVTVEDNQQLQQECLQCHVEQKIPSTLIYKRYLIKYSTSKRMAEAIFRYMKDPQKEHSIMPVPFFLKFPMKEKTPLDDEHLRKHIQSYLELFDIKKKLILEE